MTYHLLLGSNLGDRAMTLDNAVKEIEALPKTRLVIEGEKRETKAYGKEDQPDFINQALQIESGLKPDELMTSLLRIEEKLGRVRKERWGERSIDIDILLAEDTIIEDELITLPHYDLHNRLFALELLAEIAPKALHPKMNISISELRDRLREKENK